jgi:hypothetical protein
VPGERPDPTLLFHFTHLDHLATLPKTGLLCDSAAQASGLIVHEAGKPGVKEQRRGHPVPCPPGGYVADYVPFYYAPRSPTMFVIHKGGVPTYTQTARDFVYLVTTVQILQGKGVPLVFTDRNAALNVAKFSGEENELEGLVDWPLMDSQMWNNTPDDPDRMERRMAECLGFTRVPWSAIGAVVTSDNDRMARVKDLLGASAPAQLSVLPGWYF